MFREYQINLEVRRAERLMRLGQEKTLPLLNGGTSMGAGFNYYQGGGSGQYINK